MTTEIARFLVGLERTWDAHRDALLVHRDPAGAMREMTEQPTLEHIPALTGGCGWDMLERFYVTELLPHLPSDLTIARVSRTVDRFRLVDETMVSFTHDVMLPWLLPGIAATGRRVDVLAIAIVGFRRGRIASQRILWDDATLRAQLGLDGLAQTAPPSSHGVR